METLFYAHRGSSAKYAENTRAAYLQAIDEGADGIECDVHLCADGQVVCHHDPTVNRTSNASGPVGGYTLAELKAMDFTVLRDTVIPAEYGAMDEQLVTLDELLTLIDKRGVRLGLAVEIKHPSPAGRGLEDTVLQVLHSHGFDPRTGKAGSHGQIQISIMSFEPQSNRYLAGLVNPQLLCQLITEVDADWVEELVATGQHNRAEVYRVLQRSVIEGIEVIEQGTVGMIGPGVQWVRDNEAQVRQWIDRGLVPRIWTVDSVADARYLHGLGVRQLTSNHPQVLRARSGLS
ncbi:glycerophosphodiester phosphodiesterase family protein [Glutamicibacter sp. MNS18]|uniref:glycerophosphodiester phosphodiesterase n=1 Tax=Glutamicibacter sp. MNS18 TaxID=2989817 RepID=UPI002235E15D|nr:glycerophosphodiester phosphodiesterase family protein [Glutamicibacter sp. MNS18]MCW4466045.1 glycerophosphodiester phosphodiesterase family protein [Glutamicibacter sp. MNS18]